MALLPAASGVAPQSAERLQKLEASLKERDDRLAAAPPSRGPVGRAQELQAGSRGSEEGQRRRTDTHDYSGGRDPQGLHRHAAEGSQRTRTRYVNREVEVTGMPNHEGTGHVLTTYRGDDGKTAGPGRGQAHHGAPSVGQQQARLYADCLNGCMASAR